VSPVNDRLGPDAARRGANLSHIPALDGVRGVAVLNILGLHAGVWMTGGGFYNLDTFFALSGFLITSLLIAEWDHSGGIRIWRFWARRARRLLPALFLMLLGTALIFGVLVPRGTYRGLRGDALASLFYVANWHFIAGSSSYFNQTSLTSPLLHMWSLAVEEQFYLVWPLIVVGVLAVWRSLRALLIVCVIGVVSSAIEMAVLFNPGSDPTRLYFGTDTHAQSILVGATFGVALALWERRPPRPAHARRRGALVAGTWSGCEARTTAGRWVVSAIGSVGLAGCAVLYSSATPAEAFVYRGGFLLAALASTAVLWCVTCAPGTPVARILSFPLLTFVGRISYGLYLWHFPLFAYVNSARTGLSGWALLGVRMVPTFAAAWASFVLVERRLRTGTAWVARRSWVLGPVTLFGVVGALVLATTPAAAASAAATPAGLTLAATPIAASAPPVYDNAPVRALLVGDSQALTLGFGLIGASTVDHNRFHVSVADEGILGCGVADGTTFTKNGRAGLPVGWPCAPQPALGSCPPGGTFGPEQNVPCQAWAQAWAAWLGQINPNIVVLLAGGAEVFDRVFDGHTTNILDPAFATYVKAQLERAVQIATSRGALMVLMTKPCQDTGEQPDGTAWPEDSRARQTAYNSLLYQVARQHPGEVYVQDLDRVVCPGGKFVASLHGVPIRDADGVHFPVGQPGAGGAYLEPAILPYWERLGHLQEAQTGGRSIARGPLPQYLAPP